MPRSNELPPGYHLRSPRRTDLPAIASVVAESDAHLGQPPSMSEDLILQLWSVPRFDLDTDAWVIEHDDAVVAYADVREGDSTGIEAEAIVHPDHLGRGIGSYLATIVERRAAEKAPGGVRLMTGILTPDEAAARLLAARGYSFARRFRHMEIELVAPPETPDPPAGISLLPLDPNGDVRAVHHVLEDAFRDHWDFAPTSFEDFVDRSAGDGGYDPALWIVAIDGGHTVGVLTASAHRDRGWINEIGVLRSHRGRGIASALLVTSFAGFWARGLRRVRLNVDSENTSGAVSLYERVGMRTVNSYDLWARTLGS